MSRGHGDVLLAARRVQPAKTRHDNHGPRRWCSSRWVSSLPTVPQSAAEPFSFSSVSLLTCDLGLILELAGGFSATALAYIFRE